MTDIQPYDNTPTVTDDGLALLTKQAEAMEAAHKLATALCNTAMVPAAFRGKPDDATAAILFGAELGLKPQQALQQVFVVHGQPAIYARTMAGLLKAKGYQFTTVEDTPKTVTVQGTSPRGETETATWTITRAKTAGYTSNKKYQTDPQAMLYAKSLSEVCRKLAPDVLLGIRYSAEELQLEPIQMTATRRDDARGVGQVRAALAARKQTPTETEDPAEEAPQVTQAELLARIPDASADDLKVLAEIAQANLDEAEYEPVHEALYTRYYDLNPEEN